MVLILKYLDKRKVRKLKNEWIMKVATVSAVKECYIEWDKDKNSLWHYEYRLEAKDESWKVYCSDLFKNVKHGWRTLKQMKVKYNGVTYDLSDKDNAIKQLTNNIQRLEAEFLKDPWFFKKMGLKIDIKELKEYIEIAKEWPVIPYLIRNGHKISVWDYVNVFVNPNKPKEYYFDLDFTKEK